MVNILNNRISCTVTDQGGHVPGQLVSECAPEPQAIRTHSCVMEAVEKRF